MPAENKGFYEFGPYRLDLAQQLLTEGTRKIPLTPKAFQTLLALVESQGRLVDKQELLQKIWPDTFVEESTLAQNVFTLRKLLQDGGPETQYIETVPKRGYRFVAPVRMRQTDDAEHTSSFGSDVSLKARMRAWSRWVALGMAAAVVAGAAVWSWVSSRAPRVAHLPRPVMLAVLPVQNLTGDPSSDYVSDGLTEEIIAQLGGLSPARLGVIARTSSMAYKGTTKTAAQIGRELRVDYILESSVRSSGGRMRVTLQLIRISDQAHLWAEDYDRTLGDLLTFQSEVAREVAQQVPLNLTAQEQARLGHPHQVKPEAYDAYLKGRFFWNKRTPEAMTTAERYFQQAIQEDPNFASGYSGLADCYQVMINLERLKAQDGFSMARAAALKALELDNTLAEAHTSLASIKGDYDWDWKGAEAEYKQALALNPNYATAHHWYGDFLAGLGRFDESAEEIRKAQELDPLSLVISVTLAQLFCTTGHCEQGIEQLKKTLEIDPDFDEAHEALAEVYAHQGMYREALAEFGKERQPPEGHPAFLVGYAAAKAGHKEEALRMLRQMESQHDLPHRDYYLAIMYAALGDKDQAFAKLESARQSHDPSMPYVRGNFPLEELRSDPRWTDLIRRMNMPQ